MRKKLTLLASLALLTACQTQEQGYTLEGTLIGAEQLTGKVYLQKQLPNGELLRIDSTTITEGRFSLKGHIDRPERYALYIDTRTDPTESVKGKVFAADFYLENSPITFEGDLNTLPGVFYNPERQTEAPTIKGSTTEDFYAQFRQEIKPLNDSLAAIDQRYWKEYTAPMMNDKEHKNDYTATGVAIVKAEKKWAQARQEKIQSFIRQNPTSIVAFDQLVGLLSNFTVDFTAAQIDEMRGWVADAWQAHPN